MNGEGDFRLAPALAFGFYMVAVLLIGIFAHRLLQRRAFLKEYFLGSRGLGLWALAMTYAATSASGGSFTGFPALIYQHGWILALWIASYMVVPVCCMGIIGKRLNQVARKSGAITVPDVIRDRFGSPGLGIAASLFMVFFLTFNLCAQFKAGALIVEELLGGFGFFREAASYVEWIPATFSVLTPSPPQATYCLGLLLFALAVIAYTAYGGFRAVVWTDVLQGVVMFFGVLLLLGFTLSKVEGGLGAVTRDLAQERLAAVEVEALEDVEIPHGSILYGGEDSGFPPLALHGRARLEAGSRRTLTFGAKASALPETAGGDLSLRAPDGRRLPVRVLSYRHDPRHTLVSGPGFSARDPGGFLPLALAFSFFVMWAITGAGQPTTMVRLMAFKDTRVYRRAMFAVTIYYTLIYIPLVVIFVCARHLLPDLDEPDKAMARTVLHVVPGVLGGIILAAPFAAIMSTVDSFLLAISSCLVRDIFQRSLKPDASPRTMRRLSYLTTLAVGLIVMAGAINPPRFLQHIIVLTSACLACVFLAPLFFALYWPRMTARGAAAGMLLGFGVCFGLYVLGWLGIAGERGVLEPHPGGFLPAVWGLLASIAGCVLGSFLSPPPEPAETARWFGNEAEAS